MQQGHAEVAAMSWPLLVRCAQLLQVEVETSVRVMLLQKALALH